MSPLPLIRRSSFVLILAVSVLLIAPSPASARPAAQEQQMSVGVVDVDRLFQESALGRAINEELQNFQTQNRQQLQAGQQQLQQLQQDLQQLRPESDQARELSREIQLRRATLQAETQLYQNELQLRVRQANLRVLRAVSEAAAKVAQQKGLAVVIRKSPPLPDSPQAQDFEQTLLRQMTLYVSPGADITSDVLVQLDATFNSGNTGGTESGNAGAENSGE